MRGNMFTCLLQTWPNETRRNIGLSLTMSFFFENDGLAYVTILGELPSGVFYCGLFQDLKFSLIIKWLFSWQGRTYLVTFLVCLLKPIKTYQNIFWLIALNVKDVPYNCDFHETLDRVHVKYFLPKGVKNRLCPASLISLKDGIFTSITQDTNIIDGLKLLNTQTNVTQRCYVHRQRN